MKATKRIMAVVLAVMMLALMIPFAASAADNYTAEITVKPDYKVTVYRIADVTDAGAYTAVSGVDSTIKTAVEATPAVPQNILAAAEAAKKASKNTGVKTGNELTAGTTGKVNFTTTTPGLYYATVTGTPAGVNVKSTGGAIFYLSDSQNASGTSMATATVDISGKIQDGTVNVSKAIADSDMGNDNQTTAKVGENVTFTLTASVTGTKDEYLKSYVIHDTMADTLDYVKVKSVKVDTTALTEGDDYTVNSADKSDITIALSQTYLNDAKAGNNDFYASSNVIVELVGKLNNNAVVGRTEGDDATAYANTVANYNKDSLTYTNKYDSSATKEGNTVHVYTFDVDIYKVDATNNDTKLDGATFTLSNSTDTFTAETKNGGKATFAGLKKGTYTLKETVAPKGYNLNNTEYTVTIGADGTVTSAQYDATLKGVKIGDTPVVMPATGGNGTMIFTIVGASLIACAGILFVILKKRAASK